MDGARGFWVLGLSTVMACGGALPPPRADVTMPPPVAAESAPAPGAKLLRPGAPGAIVLFLRGLTKQATRDNARAAADALVSRCDPAHDVVVVFEPGLAAVWPGLARATEEEMDSHRARRGACLASRGLTADAAALKEQIALVMDERGEVRRESLEDQDPGDDLVLVAYGPSGELLFRRGIPAHRAPDQAVALVQQAEEALRRVLQRSVVSAR